MKAWRKILCSRNWYKDEEKCCGRFIKKGAGKRCKGCTIPKKIQKKVIKLKKEGKKS